MLFINEQTTNFCFYSSVLQDQLAQRQRNQVMVWRTFLERSSSWVAIKGISSIHNHLVTQACLLIHHTGVKTINGCPLLLRRPNCLEENWIVWVSCIDYLHFEVNPICQQRIECGWLWSSQLIGHFHDDITVLRLPESFRVILSCAIVI